MTGTSKGGITDTGIVVILVLHSDVLYACNYIFLSRSDWSSSRRAGVCGPGAAPGQAGGAARALRGWDEQCGEQQRLG